MKTATAAFLAFCASSVYGFGNTFGVTPRSGSVALGMAGRNAQPQKSLLQATVEVNKYIDENKLLIFTRSSDGQSQRVKYLLADSGLKFTEVDVDGIPHGKLMLEGLKQMTGRDQTPFVYIGHKYIGGHDHILAMNVSGYLGEVVKTIQEFERESDDIWYDSAPRSF